MAEEQVFELSFPHQLEDGTWDEWVQVHSGAPKPIPHPFEIKLRYSEKGELQCAGLRIGEGSNVGSGSDEIPRIRDDGTEALVPLGWSKRPKKNITSHMLREIPIGAVLKCIQHTVFPNPAAERIERSYADWLLENAQLIAPYNPASLSVAPGAARKDEFYIEQAERFAKLFAKHCVSGLTPAHRKAGHISGREAYKYLAKETGWAEVTVRGQVRRGWELAEKRGLDLKPEGIRTRRTKQPTRKTKPKETS